MLYMYILYMPGIEDPIMFTEEDQLLDYIENLREVTKSSVPMAYYEATLESKLSIVDEEDEE